MLFPFRYCFLVYFRFAHLEEFDQPTCQGKYNDFYKQKRHQPKITQDVICAGKGEKE